MIDLAGTHGLISEGDFEFHIGNDREPNGWSLASPPLSIVVRPGAGKDGSDRIEIIWQDGAIRNTWLEVVVRANSNTGLAHPDTFYFGNVVGETFDSSFGSVRPGDIHRIINQLLAGESNQAATVENLFDFNRDGLINPQDLMTAINQILAQHPPLERISNLIPAPVVLPPIHFDPDLPLFIIPPGNIRPLIVDPYQPASVAVAVDDSPADGPVLAAALSLWQTDELDSLADDPSDLLLPTESRSE